MEEIICLYNLVLELWGSSGTRIVFYPCGGNNLFAEFHSGVVEFSFPWIILGGELSFILIEEIICLQNLVLEF